LEPYIDEETMHLHHDKHHQAYIDKLNKALEPYPKYKNYTSDVLVTNWKKLPKALQEAVRNQGGGDVNHTIFWTLMKEKGGGSPIGDLANQITKDFKSFEQFKKKFNELAGKHFGSGWVWLTFVDDKLKISTLPNQDTPLTGGDYPIMGNDLWEHAWAYQYKNEKDKYFEAIWHVWNWSVINQRFVKAKGIAIRKPKKNVIKKQYGL
jgi:Fe-Mn family superoxide dismutase